VSNRNVQCKKFKPLLVDHFHRLTFPPPLLPSPLPPAPQLFR
jgi:hypothetical protein